MRAVAPVDRFTAIRSDFPILTRPTSRGKRLVYLDSAATSQKPQAVIDALSTYYEEYNANIHRGVYEIAQRATDAFEEARVKVARFIGAQTAEVVWVRNTTEAINLVAYSWGSHNVGKGDAILLTELEHHSNLVPWQLLAQRTGAQLRFIPVDDRGMHVLDDLDNLLDGCKIVAIAHVSNTLGTIAPLETIIPRAHAAGSVVLVDGAQGAAHLPLDVKVLDADFYAFSGHKMLGPTGIGALYAKRAHLKGMRPFNGGGEMIREVTREAISYADPPARFEAGTPPIIEAVGLGVALDYLSSFDRAAIAAHEHDLLSYATAAIEDLNWVRIIGRAPGKGAILSFEAEGMHAHDLATILDREGVAVRAGHHCAQVLMERFDVASTTRASFALYNTREEVDQFVSALHKARKILG